MKREEELSKKMDQLVTKEREGKAAMNYFQK